MFFVIEEYFHLISKPATRKHRWGKGISNTDLKCNASFVISSDFKWDTDSWNRSVVPTQYSDHGGYPWFRVLRDVQLLYQGQRADRRCPDIEFFVSYPKTNRTRVFFFAVFLESHENQGNTKITGETSKASKKSPKHLSKTRSCLNKSRIWTLDFETEKTVQQLKNILKVI